ncbi:unnamed protein product [Trifolium pratense]|uniref:Uncharacterized protein n=1 Tax=Trifolium pratense TaxID=57577 RepID=A0ACB0JXW9_TRIPR|nr:unnamed protein product [Trifolium pratense]
MQRRRHPNSAIFPDELMLEIISWLPVKHIIQLRCVNKFFKTLIFDPHFVRMHLNKSRRNSNLALPWYRNLDKYDEDYRLITLSIPYVLGIQTQNQYAISDPYYRLNDDLNDDSIIIRKIVGSCNGLLCVLSISSSDEHCLCFWNPATRTKSNEFMVFDCDLNCNMFSFGYDNSSQTYKVVAFCAEESGCNKVKVFSLGDNSWRDLQCFPLIPCHDDGVHFNGTINWLAYHNVDNQYVILSLDLSTETYTHLLLPLGLDDVDGPMIVLLGDRLCFCHDFEETHFVIWQMKDFGVQNSWIQLFKVRYEKRIGFVVRWLPLYLSGNGDTLIWAEADDIYREIFIYSCIDIIPCMARERGCCNGRCC